MKVVVDANIFISAFIGPGNPRALLERIVEGLDILFISDDTIREVEDVIGRPKFGRTKEQVESSIDIIKKNGRKIFVHHRHRAAGASRDPKDDKIIECALAAKADCIITGDKDLLVLKDYNGIRIVTVKEYLEIVTP